MRGHHGWYALAAAALAALQSGVELVRLVFTGAAIARVTPLAAYVVGMTFCALLAASAIGLARHRRFGFAGGTIGTIVSIGYGIYLRAAGSVFGDVYVLAGGVMVYLLLKSIPHFRGELEPAGS